jgi:hypothetical protein
VVDGDEVVAIVAMHARRRHVADDRSWAEASVRRSQSRRLRSSQTERADYVERGAKAIVGPVVADECLRGNGGAASGIGPARASGR